MGKAVSGGGILSNKVTQRVAPKTEPKARAVNPGGVSQLGSAIGKIKGGKLRPAEPLFQGKGYNAPKGPSDNVSAVGVGCGRTVYDRGYQGQHGPSVGTVRPGHTGDLLREFGPDVPGKSGGK
jgi:hypothetical protein